MTERKVFGMTHEQFMADGVAKRQAEWDHQIRMEDAFNKIKPAGHWKDKIEAQISNEDWKDCYEACIHFTGTVLKVTKKLSGGYLQVQAKGYWGGPCN